MGRERKNYLSGPSMGFCIISIKLRKKKKKYFNNSDGF